MRCVRWSLIVLLMLGIGAGCERGGEGEPECAPMEFAILDVSGCAFHEDGEFVFRSREPWDAFVEEYCGGEDPEDGSTDFEGDMIAGVVVSGSGCDGAVEPVSILECPFLLEFRFHPVFEGTCTAVITSTLFVRLPRSVLPVKFIEVP